jgi:predicted RNase H-like HicB family nuclease
LWVALAYVFTVIMQIEIEREEDGQGLTEIADLPGVMAYGQTQAEAVAKVKALALRVMADRLEHGEEVPELVDVFSVPA